MEWRRLQCQRLAFRRELIRERKRVAGSSMGDAGNDWRGGHNMARITAQQKGKALSSKLCVKCGKVLP